MAKPVYIEMVEEIYRGDDWVLPITFYSDESYTTPLDISAATFRCHIREKVNGPLVIATTCTKTGNPGELTISLTHEQTAVLKARTYKMDLEQTNGTVFTPLRWEQVTVIADVTNDAG